jgi:uncharacterized protein YjbI with pentapeptide repeats
MDDTPEPNNQEPDAHRAGVRRNVYIALAAIGVMLAAALIYFTSAGFGPFEATAGGARPPTLWDWLQLLVVPVVLALGALWFNKTQKDTELRIAEKARTADREIAEARQRQVTLEAYYDRMTELLLTHKLREADADAEARSIARARTVAVVKNLDGPRNGQLFGFLKASRLMEKVAPVIDPAGIDFLGADLSTADLRGANLSGADLLGANLNWADLREAHLSGAYLYAANLSGASLGGADLSGTNLFAANLSGADLSGAYLSGVNLFGTNLRETNLDGTNLRAADLRGADLSGASLGGADLSGANLSGADLRGANLIGADLIMAQGWTIDQFNSAKTLEGATMPDGVKLWDEENPNAPTYEEWKASQLGIRN